MVHISKFTSLKYVASLAFTFWPSIPYATIFLPPDFAKSRKFNVFRSLRNLVGVSAALLTVIAESCTNFAISRLDILPFTNCWSYILFLINQFKFHYICRSLPPVSAMKIKMSHTNYKHKDNPVCDPFYEHVLMRYFHPLFCGGGITHWWFN